MRSCIQPEVEEPVVIPTVPAPPPASDAVRVSARRAQTRDRLMAAATTVFAERGVNGASVEEICETAGFTRGAFYSNFADKDALVLALIQADVAAQYAAAQQALEEVECALGDQPVAEVVSQTLARLDRFGATSREGVLAQRELLLHAARVPALHGAYTDFLQTSSRQLRTLLEGALERVGLEFVLPVELAVEVLLSTHDRVQTAALFDEGTDTTALQAVVLAITRPADAGTRSP
jgi:AcrR family transcriptional regulator